jgi:uncharacterized repeat protein (TIGR02543 family)
MGTSNCTLTANFERLYTLSWSNPSGGSISVTQSGSSVSSGTYYPAGTQFNITATPSSGYVFTGWGCSGSGTTLGDASSASTTLTLGTANATLTANFMQPPTVISSRTDWDNFATAINCGYNYYGQTVYLAADISSVSTMAGTWVSSSNYKAFSGTFDGYYNNTAHSISVSLGSSSSPITVQGAAPFQCISGATIQNLTVTGTVTSTAHHASGLVGFCAPGSTNIIQNCHVSTNVSNSNAYNGNNGNNYMGGLLGHNNSATTSIIGTVYDGTLTSQGFKGGFIGFTAAATINITNSYFGGGYSTNGYSDPNFSPIGVKPANQTPTLHITNFYYNTDAGTFTDSGYQITNSAPKHAYSVTAQSPVTVEMRGNPISNGTYDVSGLTFYNPSFVYGGTIYGGSGESLALTLSGNSGNYGYQTDHGTLTGSGSSYSLAMEAYDTQIWMAPTPIVMTCGETYSGDLGTSGIWNSYPGSTWNEPGEEHVYAFTPLTDATYTFSAVTNSGDPDFFLMESNSNQGTCLKSWNTGDYSCSLTGGQTYYLVCDNCTGTSSVGYTVSVSCAKYTLTFSAGTGGSITVRNNGSSVSSGSYVEGGTVLDITATPNSGYAFSGWTVTGSGASVASTAAPVTTFTMGSEACTLTANFVNAQSIPYTENFESNSWTVVNGSATNKWYRGSLGANNSSYGYYISNDNGTSNAYTIADGISIVYIYKNVYFPEAGTYSLSFDLRQQGESSYDCVGALLYANSDTPEASTTSAGSGFDAWPSGYVLCIGGAGKALSGGNWVRPAFTFNVSSAGIYKLTLAWKNDGSVGTQPPASIDNVYLTKTSPLTFSANPSGSGSVSVTQNGTSVSSGASVGQGETLNITATPAAGYKFNGWTVSGSGASVANANSATTTFTMGSEASTLTANFVEWTMNVATSPAATECLTSGTEVTMTASHDIPIEYAFTATSSTYSSISGSPDGTSTSTGDDATYQVSLPFAFNLAGKNFAANTTLYMRCDGFVAFGSSWSTNSPSSPGTSHDVISAFGYDQNLISGESYMYYKVTGSAGSRVLTLEWYNMRSYYTTYTYANYQVKLYEGSNIVELCYGPYTHGSTRSIYAYLSANGNLTQLTSFSSPNVSSNTTGSTTSISVSSAEAAPANGTVYRFTPPLITYAWSNTGTAGTASGNTYTASPTTNSSYTASVTYNGATKSQTVNVTVTPATPSNLEASNITTNSATVSWDANGASSWKYSINGGSWTTTSVTSVDLTSLTLGTSYTFVVKSVNGSCESGEESTTFSTMNGYNVTATVSPAGVGTVSGTGIILPGENFTVTATATNQNYVFAYWEDNYVWNGTTYHDISLYNPYTYNDVNEDHTLVAHFAPLQIGTATQWNELCDAVNHGFSYQDQTVLMTANVGTVSTMAGVTYGEENNPDSDYAFRGTFNGQGHTLTVGLNSGSGDEGQNFYYLAPFRKTWGASIQNLKVAGNITTAKQGAGGIAGLVIGTTFTNCVCEATITNNYNDGNPVDATSGGMIAVVRSSTNITGCAFTGTLTSSTNADKWGGFVGWRSSGTLNITNCVFAPSSTSGIGTSSCTNFCRNGATITNSYYTQALGSSTQGKQRYTVSAGTNVSSIAISGETTTHGASGITSYSGSNGLLYNGTIIAGDGDEVNLTVNYNGSVASGYFARYTCTSGSTIDPSDGSDGSATLATTLSMGAVNTTISATTMVSSFEITAVASPPAGGIVEGGGTYSNGATVTLTARANTGYTFTNWTKNSTQVGTAGVATLSFTATEDATYTANFTLNTYTVSLSANPSDGGTVSGNGDYGHGSSPTVTATPATGYSFVNWTENNVQVSTSANYTINNITADHNLVANFELDSHTLTINYVFAGGGEAAPTHTENVNYGASYSVNSPAVTGYTPNQAVVSGTMGTQDVTVTVTYSVNSYTLTINYLYTGGGTAATAYTESVNYGASYSVNSPAVTGYTPNQATVSGTMPADNVTVNVTYSVNSYTLTINYKYANGTTAAATHTETLNYEASYNVPSPAITGYTPDQATVSGTMPADNVTVDVTYTIDSHRLTINYVYAGGGEAAPTHTENVDYNETYSVASPTVNGYTPDQATVSGTMGTSDVTVTVTYSQDTYTVSVTADPSAGGSAEGGGNTYHYGTQCTVRATAFTGYTFDGWKDESNTIVSSSASYTFSVTRSIDLTAVFTLNSYDITATANPSEGGTISGQGTFSHGAQCNLTATANPGYTFVNWTKDGSVVSTSSSYSFSVTEAAAFVANFSQDEYTVTLAADPTGSGTLSGGGSYYYNSTCPVSATAATGYTFNGWYEGNTLESSTASFDYTVTHTCTLTARFTPISYTVTVTAYPSDGGSVSGAGSHDYNTSCSLSATPGSDYRFVNWTEGGSVVSSDNPYSFTVTGNRTLVANFELATVTITKTIEGHGGNPGHWHLITSPLDGTVAPTDVTNMVTTTPEDYDLYYFQPSPTATSDYGFTYLEWVNYKDTEHGGGFSLEAGKGYLYARRETADLVFYGVPVSGEYKRITITNSHSGSKWDGWNLVGNPFTVTAELDKDYYEMNPEGNEFVAGTTYQVERMGGVFVHTTDASEILTFTRNPGGGAKRPGLALDVNGSHGLLDRAILRFGNNGTLPKMQLNPNHTKVYFPLDDTDYAVVSADNDMGEIPVSFKAERNGRYSFDFSAKDVAFDYLHLVDNLTGDDTDLLETPTYSFDAKSNDYPNRFKLVFVRRDADNDNDSFTFYSNGSWVVNNDGKAELQVIDVTGRILKRTSISGCASINFQVAKGVYMIRLVNGNNVKTQKVVVR